jgi:hypothetical protein
MRKTSVKNHKNRDKVGFHFSCFLNRKIHILTHNQRFLSLLPYRHPYHNNISLKDKTAKPDFNLLSGTSCSYTRKYSTLSNQAISSLPSNFLVSVHRIFLNTKFERLKKADASSFSNFKTFFSHTDNVFCYC